MGDMTAPLRVRIREGCRGGREQFTWNQIKEQDFKDREQYLGQSTKVGMMGKFGNYYVHDWFARKRETAESIQTELKTVQAYEEELMKEALGLKPKKLMLSKTQLTEDQVKEFLKRDEDRSEDKKGMTPMGPQKKIVTNEYGEQVATSNEDYVAVAAREAPVKGIGFAHHRTAKLEEIKAQTFGTSSSLAGSSSISLKYEAKGEVKEEMKDEVKREDDTASVVDGVVDARAQSELREVKQEEGAGGREGRKRDRDEEPRSKSEKKNKKRKKEEKKIKKMEKKIKKAAKKERKAAKRAKKAKSGGRVSSSSSSSSS